MISLGFNIGGTKIKLNVESELLHLLGSFVPSSTINLLQSSPSQFSYNPPLRNTEVIDVDNPNPNTHKKMALVIGNTYANKPGCSLPCSRNDALYMDNVLKKRGYQVHLGLDLSKDEMRHSITSFANSLEEGDTALFYFSGHGILLDGIMYIFPDNFYYDSRESLMRETFPYTWILHSIVRYNPKFKVFLYDACRTNFHNNIHNNCDRDNSIQTAYEDINKSGKGSNVVFACSTLEACQSYGMRDGLSFWTGCLVNVLNKQNRPDRIQNILHNTRMSLSQSLIERNSRFKQTPLETFTLLENFEL